MNSARTISPSSAMSHDDEVKAAVEKTLSRFGRLNAVHNNAGISHTVKADSRNH